MASKKTEKFLGSRNSPGNRNNISKAKILADFIAHILPVALAGGSLILIQIALRNLLPETEDFIILSGEIFLALLILYCFVVLLGERNRANLQADYEALEVKYQAKVNETEKVRQDLLEYFLLWVHQIKTPIAAAKLITGARQREHDSELRSQIVSIEKYTDMAISYLKLASGDAEIYVEKVDLDKVLKKILKKYAVLFISNDIELDYRLQPEVVVSDGKWLALALEQILSNATKYAAGERVYIRFSSSDNALVIGDTGMGIPAEDIPKIFDKGYSGFNGQNNGKSTGIGLYLTKRILERLNHPIYVESKLGKGTEFRIRFPRSTDLSNL